MTDLYCVGLTATGCPFGVVSHSTECTGGKLARSPFLFCSSICLKHDKRQSTVSLFKAAEKQNANSETKGFSSN